MSFQLLFLLGFLLLSSAPPCSSAESPVCLAVYKEGGAPAVFRSPKCPRWTLVPDDLRRRPSSPGCHLAVHQGRRRSQEDRAVCALGMRIPFLGMIFCSDGCGFASESYFTRELLPLIRVLRVCCILWSWFWNFESCVRFYSSNASLESSLLSCF